MTWRYEQATGKLYHAEDDQSPTTLVANGYSGHGSGLNNPALEQVHDIGPIPRGTWLISEMIPNGGKLGPMVMHLTPIPGTDTLGRSGFFIHGDSAQMNHTASDGCIILPRDVRVLIGKTEDRRLVVA